MHGLAPISHAHPASFVYGKGFASARWYIIASLWTLPLVLGICAFLFICHWAHKVWHQTYGPGPISFSSLQLDGFSRQDVLIPLFSQVLKKAEAHCPDMKCAVNTLAAVIFTRVKELDHANIIVKNGHQIELQAWAQRPWFLLQTKQDAPVVVTKQGMIFPTSVLPSLQLPLVVLPNVSRSAIWDSALKAEKNMSLVSIAWDFQRLQQALGLLPQDLFLRHLGRFLNKIEWDAWDGFRLYTADNCIWDFGKNNFDTKVRRLAILLSYTDKKNLLLQYVDLDYTDRVIYRVYETTTWAGEEP